MAGVAIRLDLWRKNQKISSGLHSPQAFQSSAFFSASAAVGAAASFAAGTSFASRALFGYAMASFFSTLIVVSALGMDLLCCVEDVDIL